MCCITFMSDYINSVHHPPYCYYIEYKGDSTLVVILGKSVNFFVLFKSIPKGNPCINSAAVGVFALGVNTF